MNIFQKKLFLSSALWIAVMPQVALAQDSNFVPVMATFDGKNALVLAPSPALDINGFGTIEFWVAAKWTANPGYDPAVMGYSGSKGSRFAVHITGDAKALGIQAGPYYELVEFDFSDGQPHHVALTTIGETISVMIDGEVEATLGYGFANLPATSFSIGSVGRFSPFIGQIGQVRIWDEPIDPDLLVKFSWQAIEADGPNAHPELDSLVGLSAFGNPEVGGFLFSGDPDDPELVSARLDPDDEEGLDPPAVVDPAT
jgi:hypothetical protein